ncbi:MAG: hypothetical protein WDN26_11070 [Chitinophagaceae bacterium]
MDKTFHPVKVYACIFAALTSSSMLLTWTKLEQQGIGWAAEKTNNGYNDWGFLALFGFIGVFAAVLMGKKLNPFNQVTKVIAMGSFGLIALGAIVTATQGGTDNTTGVTTKIGIGVWIAIFDAIAGLLFVSGVVKPPVKKEIALNPSQHLPPSPPPPPLPPKS